MSWDASVEVKVAENANILMFPQVSDRVFFVGFEVGRMRECEVQVNRMIVEVDVHDCDVLLVVEKPTVAPNTEQRVMGEMGDLTSNIGQGKSYQWISCANMSDND